MRLLHLISVVFLGFVRCKTVVLCSCVVLAMFVYTCKLGLLVSDKRGLFVSNWVCMQVGEMFFRYMQAK